MSKSGTNTAVTPITLMNPCVQAYSLKTPFPKNFIKVSAFDAFPQDAKRKTTGRQGTGRKDAKQKRSSYEDPEYIHFSRILFYFSKNAGAFKKSTLVEATAESF